MWFIHWLIGASVRNRAFVFVGVIAFALLGLYTITHIKFDAFPDLTNVQVQIVTSSAGMSAEEVEKLVTVPIERSLGGVPGLVEVRSKSRTGISAINAIFEDTTDVWHARQLVKERLDAAKQEIPPSAGTPEIGPPSTGLGEIYQIVIHSEARTMAELYRLFERDIAPRVRSVPGVVEVNAWGGGQPQLDVMVDPWRLAARGLTLPQVEQALSEQIGRTSGGAIPTGPEQTLLQASANPTSPDQLAGLLLAREPDGQPILVSDVATPREGRALTVGMGSADGRGESIFAMVQMLTGADALKVVGLVDERMAEIKKTLPDDVEIEVVYRRDVLVNNTLYTVKKSLLEGGLLVILVLFILLGDVRAGLIVASVIPLSMLGAFVGLAWSGYSGNLMSLGAIDFGLVVDGSIVIVETIVALELGKHGHLGDAVVERSRKVAGPVLFAVGILILVYIPILALWGTEGKLFRPMALTVLFALVTSLVLSLTYVPALAATIMRPHGDHHTRLMSALLKLYSPALEAAMRRPALMAGAAAALVAVSVAILANMGVEFVPRLQEGDLVVQTRRLPSISPEQALREATRVERVLKEFPEVVAVGSRTGAPAVATDPMGMEEADILVRLAPRDQWRTAKDTEGLMSAIAARLEVEAPGVQLNFTQPIEMRFNEMLEGVTGDVGIKVFGPDLPTLLDLSDKIATAVGALPGAADVARPAMEGAPTIELKLDGARLARHGVTAAQIFSLVTAAQRGVEVAQVVRGEFRDPVVLRLDEASLKSIKMIPIATASGAAIPLGELVEVVDAPRPAVITREGGSRRVTVEMNVRGRDLGSFVQEAQVKVAEIKLPPGYRIDWGGKYEQLKEATRRMGTLIPAVLFLILGILYIAFGRWRPTLLIFLNVPVAISGGVLILWARGLPLSMPALVGCIALFGLAVMNGIVLVSRTQELHMTLGAREAATRSARERFRPVLTTALVAALGFVPMALATGVGSEVQRPLATVVIGGLVTSTILTLLVLPALYAKLHRDEPLVAPQTEQTSEAELI
jgi:cobalt-zinc-cadmium resistance protein CzcA